MQSKKLIDKRMAVTRAYQTTFTTRLTVVVFFSFQCSESNIQGDRVGVNATDSLAQAADRQERVSSLYSLLVQSKKTILQERFRLLTQRRQFVNN